METIFGTESYKVFKTNFDGVMFLDYDGLPIMAAIKIYVKWALDFARAILDKKDEIVKIVED